MWWCFIQENDFVGLKILEKNEADSPKRTKAKRHGITLLVGE